MKKLIQLISCLITFGIFIPFSTYAFDYVIDVTQHAPQKSPPPKPTRGVPFVDPDFGTTIVRLTDAATEGGNYVGLRYAKWSPENANSTMALLASRNGWLLYNVDKNSPNKYSFIKRPNLPYGNGEPRWDGKDPNIIYFTDKMGFYKYDVRTDKYSLIRDFSSDFPQGTEVFMDDEGDSSADSRYWAWFVVQSGVKNSAFSYDKDYDLYNQDADGKTGKIIGTLSHDLLASRHGGGDSNGANWIGFTDTGKKIIVGTERGSWYTSSYDKDFTNGVALNVWCGHSDTAIDANGNEILFGFDMKGDGYTYVDLNTGNKVRMLRRPWPNPNDYTGACCFGHVTGTDSVSKPGWGLYSAYCTCDCTLGTKFDCLLIYMMEFKDVGHDADPTKVPRVWQIAHSYSSGGYNSMPKAVINHNGTRIYFTSRWEWRNDETSQDIIETYIIELPATWYKDLAGNTPPTVSASASPTTGTPPLTVTFTGTANDPDGKIVSYRWYFGDGGSSTETNPTYIYNKGGNYTVALEVTDNGGATSMAFVPISVVDPEVPAPPTVLSIN